MRAVVPVYLLPERVQPRGETIRIAGRNNEVEGRAVVVCVDKKVL